MSYYAGLDASLKEVSICVVDNYGEVVTQGTAPADPEGVAGWFKNRSLTPKRIIVELCEKLTQFSETTRPTKCH